MASCNNLWLKGHFGEIGGKGSGLRGIRDASTKPKAQSSKGRLISGALLLPGSEGQWIRILPTQDNIPTPAEHWG